MIVCCNVDNGAVLLILRGFGLNEMYKIFYFSSYQKIMIIPPLHKYQNVIIENVKKRL